MKYNVMTNQNLLASIQLVVFDFDGVFTDNRVFVDQNGSESVACWRSDGLGLSRIHEVGIKAYIVSTETNPVVTQRANKLKIACRQSVADKAACVLEICDELNVTPQETMFVGNDINDIPAFDLVAAGVGVADSYDEIDPHILFRTEKSGGFGAVREICDMLYHSKKNQHKRLTGKR